jgi:hypothetical protein
VCSSDLEATASGLKLASLHDEEVAAHERTQMDNTLTIDSGKLRTSLLISADDFDELTIPSASQLTFCVKELKAVLQYVRSAISREVCRFAFCDGGDPLILHGGSSESTAGGAHSAALNAYASPSDVSVKLVIATAIGANLGAEVESIGNQQRSASRRCARRRQRGGGGGGRATRRRFDLPGGRCWCWCWRNGRGEELNASRQARVD